MKYNKLATLTVLLCAAANPAWSGVPHGIQRTNTSQQTATSIAQVGVAQSSANDECAGMASLEKEIGSLRSRIDDMLAELRVRDARNISLRR